MRRTVKDVDRLLEAVTAEYHAADLLHPDARFIRASRNGYHGIEVTGGPHLGTGCDTVVIGVPLGEVARHADTLLRAIQSGGVSWGAR